MLSALTFYIYAFVFGVLAAGFLYFGFGLRRKAVLNGRSTVLPVCMVVLGFQLGLFAVGCFAPVIALWVIKL